MIRLVNSSLVLFLILTVSVLSGCEAVKATKKIAQVLSDPDVPVGEKDEQPSMIALHAYAAADVNSGQEMQAKPVDVKIFALSNDHRLFSYDFFSLLDSPEETLGVTLVDFLDESTIEPDSYVILGPYELPPRTKKIGIIAAFNDIEATTWRASISVDSIDADDRLLMLLLEEEVRLITEGR